MARRGTATCAATAAAFSICSGAGPAIDARPALSLSVTTDRLDQWTGSTSDPQQRVPGLPMACSRFLLVPRQFSSILVVPATTAPSDRYDVSIGGIGTSGSHRRRASKPLSPPCGELRLDWSSMRPRSAHPCACVNAIAGATGLHLPKHDCCERLRRCAAI
jgi:hypothetical protein